MSALLAGALLAGAAAAHAAADPGASVSAPLPGDHFSGFGNTRSVTFSGFVSSPSTVTSIGIDVLKAPNLDASNEANWLKNVVTTVPSNGTYSVTLTSGRGGISATAWPDGGIARTRVMSNMTDGTRIKTFVQDRAGVPTLDSLLTLTDVDPSPTSFSATPRRIDRTPSYLNAKDSKVPHFTDATAQSNETLAYYNAVRTCPGNATTSCTSRLANLTTLSAFQSRYLTANGNGTLVNAKYYNVGDLGIGRDMTCNVSSSPSGIALNQRDTVEIACAVKNYAPKVANVLKFDDQNGSFNQMDTNQAPFATVVMVYRGFVLGGLLNRTFFGVYDSGGVLLTPAAQLDSKGYNTFIPGNCMVCHAAGGQYDQTQHGSFSNYFLPFDLTAFGFNGAHPRAAQEDAFRKLNYEVMLSETGSLPVPSELINGWYNNQLAPFVQAAGPTQNTSFIPAGWNGTARTRDLYQTVIAPNCRGCHVTSFNIPFRNSTELINAAETGPGTQGLAALADVCSLRKMPNAEQSLKHGWTDPTRAASLRAMLLTHIPQSCTNGVCKTYSLRCDPRNPVSTAAFKNDFDGDGVADMTAFLPSSSTWSTIKSSDPSQTSPAVQNTGWGTTGDVPVPADYDADGKTDVTVWRPSDGNWFVLLSGTPGFYTQATWGVSGDKPVPGDYDGDGKIDFTVWRPSNGTWYVLLSGTPGYYTQQQWGLNGDLPVPGDYDGDGRTDFAVWRPSNATWYVIKSSTGATASQQWGANGDIPIPGEYDGDSKTDFAVYRPSNATWFTLKSSTGTSFQNVFGSPGTADRPVPADFDGDGLTDQAIFHSSSGKWDVRSSVRGGFLMDYGTLGVAASVTPF